MSLLLLLTGPPPLLALADSTVGLTDFGAVLSGQQHGPDMLGLSDATSTSKGYVRSIADQLGAADAVVSAEVEAQAVTEPLGLSDAVAVVQVVGRTITDSAGLSDLAIVPGSHPRAVDDSAGMADDLVSVLTVPPVFTGALGTANSMPGRIIPGYSAPAAVPDAVAHDRAVTDALGLSDQASAVLTAGGVAHDRVVTDSISLRDADFDEAREVAQAVASPVGMSDSVTQATAGAGTAAATDAIGLSDTITPASGRARTVPDVAGLTDSVTPGTGRGRSVSDAASLSDSVTVQVVNARPITDTAGLSDLVAVSVTRATSNLLGLTDTVQPVLTVPTVFEPWHKYNPTLTLVATPLGGLATAGAVAALTAPDLADTQLVGIPVDRTAALAAVAGTVAGMTTADLADPTLEALDLADAGLTT